MLPVRAADRPDAAGPVDLVLFTVKAYDVEPAGAAIRPAVGPETAVLCLQNGVDTEARLAAVLGPRAVLGGVTYVSAAIEAPGVIRHTGLRGDVVMGEMDGQMTARVRVISSTLRRAGAQVNVTKDIVRVLWEKFVFICAMGGMTALTRLGMGEVFAYPESRAMFRGLMEEAAAVGRARGIALAGVVDRHMRFMEDRIGAEPEMRASLHHDLAAGRRMELDALCGAVVRMGRDAGVPTPLSVAVVAALRPHERKAAAAARG